MFSWINNTCVDTGNTFSTLVSADSIVAGQDFGRMLGAVSREVHLNEKSMYRLVPWTENAVCFRPGSVVDGINQLEDNGFWSTFGGAIQSHHHAQQQQSKQQPPMATSTAKLDSVPATPPLHSDIVTLVSPSAATADCDKVVGQLPTEFATFIESLPVPYGASCAGIHGQFSVGNVNSCCSVAAPETERGIRLKQESCNPDAQPIKLGSVHSVTSEAKDDQVKKILSKCGKWTQTATANKSLQWTTVGIDKPKLHGRTKGSGDGTKKSNEVPPGRQHYRSFRPVPSEKAEHVQRERERRIQLRAMYKTLDTLVPAQSRNLKVCTASQMRDPRSSYTRCEAVILSKLFQTAKRDRTTIVNDALNYVKEMRTKLEKLQAYKAKPIMSIALSQLIAQNIDKRNSHGLAGAKSKTLSPTSTSTVDVEHGEGDTGIDESTDTSIVLVTPDVHVFTASVDQVLININCQARPDLLSRILKALDLLQLDVSHYTFSRLCAQFVNCHFAAKIRTTANTSRLAETIRAVLGGSLSTG